MSPDSRYTNDPVFHRLVDLLVASLHDFYFTPSELREAAMLASQIHEARHIRPLVFYKGSESGRFQCDKPNFTEKEKARGDQEEGFHHHKFID